MTPIPDVCKDCKLSTVCTLIDQMKLTRTGKCDYKECGVKYNASRR
jgi:hypothetical protein